MAVSTRIPAETPAEMKTAILRFLAFRATQERAKCTTTHLKREKEIYEQRAAFAEELAAEIEAAE